MASTTSMTSIDKILDLIYPSLPTKVDENGLEYIELLDVADQKDPITRAEAKQALYLAMVELVGEDEATMPGFSNTADLGEFEDEAVRNGFRADLRNKLREYFGEGK